MDVQWQWNKQQPWLVTLIAGWRHAYPWHHSKEEEKKSKIKPYLQKKKRGYWVQNSQARRVRLFDPLRESDFSQEIITSGWKQMLLLLHGALVNVFTLSPLLYCTAGNVWSVVFSTCHKIPMLSLLSDQQNNPCSAWFKPLLWRLPTPIHTNPLQLQSCSERDPTQNFGRRHQMVVVFVLLTLSLVLPLFLCVCYLSVIEHSTFR